MNQYWLMKLFVWLLGIVLLGDGEAIAVIPHAISVGAESIDHPQTAVVVNRRSQQPENPQQLLQQLASVNVVYLGESHDRPEDHQLQLAILETLQSRHPELVIGMEMFQRPYQSVLDRYLAGKLTEDKLQDLSEYPTRWGYPWEFYAPILKFAQRNRLPVVALNTPTEVTYKVARQGLNRLTWIDQRFTPPISAIVQGPEAYRQRLLKLYKERHQGRSNSTSFERFFQAQVLWDETMAERIAQVLQKNPQALVVALVGQGHIACSDGIPDRVARRLQSNPAQTPFVQTSILLNPPPEMRSQDCQGADYFWYSAPKRAE